MIAVQDLVYRIGATNEGLKSTVRDSQQSIRGLMSTVERSSQTLAQWGRRAVRTGSVLTGIAVAIGKTSIDAASTFEKQMRRVQAISQSTVSEYRALSSAAIDMSTKTEHSAMAVAEGMNFMAMAGFNASQIMEAMPSVLQLATAGVMDLGTAADITTNILTGYGLELSELGKANDVLVSAMTGANVDLQMLGESFKFVGPLARSAGVAFEEAAAIIAMLGNAGIQGSMAGTALRSAITRLLNPTKQAQAVLARLGVTVKDASTNQLLPMADILRQLEEAGADASDMMILFGERAGPALTSLIGQGIDNLEKYIARLRDSEGLAAKIEAQLLNTAEGQRAVLRNTASAIRQTFANDLLPYYRTFIFYLQGVADRLRQLEPEQRIQILRFGAMAAGIAGLITVLGVLALGVSGITNAFLALGGALTFIMSVKGLAIAGIILGVGLLKKAWDSDFGGIKTKTEEVWKVVGPVLENFWEILQRSWVWTIDIAKDIWDWIINTTWAEKWEDIKGWLDTTWNWVITIGTGIKEWIFNTTWAEKWADIKGLLDTVWEWTVNLLGDAWEWLEKRAPWLTTTLETLWSYVEEAWTWTVNKAIEAWEWLEENAPWLTSTLETLKGLIADTWEWTIDALGTAWDWLTETTWVEKVRDVKSLLSEAWEWTINIAGDAWAWFKDTKLGQWLDDLKTKITDSKAWKWTIDVGLPVIIEGGKAVIKAVVEAGGRMYDAIKKGLDTGDWSDFWNVASDIWSKGMLIVLGLQLASQAATAILAAIGSIFGNAAGKLGISGIPLAIGLLTVGIQLMEAQAEGSYEAFVKNVLVAALVGAIGGAVFGPTGALIGFNLTLSLKLGEKIEEGIYTFAESMGLPRSHLQMLEEYEQYRQALIDEATKDMNWLQKRLWILAGNKPEGLLEFPEWKKAMGYVTEELESVTKSVEETIEAVKELDEVLNITRGFDPLLDAIYRAEGGAKARVPYGMTGFADAGNKFSNERNQALFEELARGLEEGSEEYYRAAVSVSVQHYWRTFEQKFPEVAGKTFEELDPTMQQLFVLHLGRWFSPPSAHELNKNWVPNVLSILGYEDAAAEFRAGSQELLNTWIEGVYDMASDVEAAAAYIAGIFADYLVGQSPPPKGPLSNIKLGMKNTMSAGIEGAEEGLLGGIGQLLLSAQKIGEVTQVWGSDFVRHFTEGVEEEAFAQRDRIAQIAAFTLRPFTFDDPENDLWAFSSGSDMLKWFGKGMASAAKGVVELVKTLIDALFNAIRTKIAERYPELLEFFNSLKEEVDEAIKAVEELLGLGSGGEDEGGKQFKTLSVETERWIKTLTDGLASAIAYGRSLYDVFDNFLRMIAQSALQEIFDWGVGKVLTSLGLEFASDVPTFHYGGLVMHSGGVIDGLRPDEVPLIAQRGERILSRKQNDKFEQMLEDFEFEGVGSNVNVNIYAMDAKSFVDMVRRNPEAITSVLVDDFQRNGVIRRLVMG